MNIRYKKIIVLHVMLSMDVGGMEKVVADLVRSLDPARFKPVVVCLQLLGENAEELAGQGYRVIGLPAMTPGLSMFYPARLVEAIRKSRADIVHIHSGCWFKAAVAARLAGVKRVVFTEHGRAFPDRAINVILDRLSSRMTKSVVAVSARLDEYMSKVVRVEPSKMSVIVNGIDTRRFRCDRGDGEETAARIGVIARLEPVKDISTLLRAMKLVVRECPSATLDVVGIGPERDALESLADDLGLVGKVRFHGLRRDIPEALAGLDIFALSSLSEGTSVTILEAMSSGLPVVATRVGGTPAVVEDGVNGCLVTAGRPDEMARAILTLAKDARLRRRMGLANREKVVMEYGIEAMAARYESLYSSLMDTVAGKDGARG